jgi:hypothetical protein
MDRWTIGVATAAVAGMVCLFPAAARAQEEAPVTVEAGVGQEIVGRCLEEMRATVRKTADAIGAAADRAIGQVETLAENGAPDGALIRAGGKGIAMVDGVAKRGHERITGIAARCARVLTRVGAPPAAFEAVREGAQRAHEAIAGHAQGARGAIAATLEEALDGGEEPAPE